jgi:hypothetical protein
MPSAPEYRTLGLRPREARLEVIRSAVSTAASHLREEQEQGEQAGDEAGDQQLAAVALAGYRLLDPRRRTNLVERIHLLVATEEEAETTAVPLWKQRAQQESSAGETCQISPGSHPRGMAAVAHPKSANSQAANHQDANHQDANHQPALPPGAEGVTASLRGARDSSSSLPGRRVVARDASEVAGAWYSENAVEETRVAREVIRVLRQQDRHAAALRIAVIAVTVSVLCLAALLSAYLLP